MEQTESKRGGARKGAGRPVGWRKTENTGRKTIFASLTISGTPEEVAAIKKLADDAGKSASKYIIESLLKD